ncbi:glycosyltransferase [Catenovulum sp. SM1970]|uniref:glycosyltransferase n=1 Tax=Marinifaba aquimaris TaxID=2741323 RepID=UPI001572D57E|nr:glycosyltransferase [Marinifaba aquimaris]NTS76160.1 glycosyltransferase [Marinifaba aquimaris]
MFTTVQIVQKLCPGGIETMALDFAQYTQANERNFIISLDGKKSELLQHWPRLKNFSDKIICLEKPPGFSLKAILKLKQLLIDLESDCIHTHHIGPLIYGGTAARLVGISNILHTEHDAWHLNNKKHRILQKIALHIAKPTFIADSNLVADIAAEKLGNISPEVIYNGVDTDKFCLGQQADARARMQLPQDVKLIGCAGRLETVKGQEVLLEAMARLPSFVHVALAGIGSNEQNLRKLCKELDIEKRVHFLGLVEDMPSFYQSLDIFCLPSYNEGFPLSPLEAQSCGIPVVLTNTGASFETLCPDLGEIVKPGDSFGMANAIRKVNLHLSTQPNKESDALMHNEFNFASQKAKTRNFVKEFAAIEQMLNAYQKLKMQ